MPHTKSEAVYYYNELNDTAQATARDWYREGNLDYGWWNFIYDDFLTITGYLGYETDRKQIQFSGFSSQGDGACFTGIFRSGDVKPGATIKHAPKDDVLASIVAELEQFAQEHPTFFARMTHRGNYSHSYSVSYELEELNTDESADVLTGETEKEFTDYSRRLMDWLYRRLENEYDYLLSDAVVAETIVANEYEFTKEGSSA